MRLRTKAKQITDKMLTFIVRPFVTRKTKNLIYRRGGIIRYLELRHTFREIGRDPWVSRSREIYGENHAV